MRLRAIVISVTCALLCSCATPHTAPRFNAPSTKPIAQATQKARQSVSSAKEKAKVIEATIEKEPPGETTDALKLQAQALAIDLDNALASLDSSEGARQQLETQIQEQTKTANELAVNYDKSQLQITGLEASRHRWVKYFWYSTGLLALAGIWIFKRPLMMLAGGIL